MNRNRHVRNEVEVSCLCLLLEDSVIFVYTTKGRNVISKAKIEKLPYLTSRQMFQVKHVKIPLRIFEQQLYSSPLECSHYSFKRRLDIL